MMEHTLYNMSLDSLHHLFLNELTIFNFALFYILTYVIYKALGRYIYFKPQEHASKINRTFLTVSLLVVMSWSAHNLTELLPILPEHRWFFTLASIAILIAPLSIVSSFWIWRRDPWGGLESRSWHYDYLQVPTDYFKTTVSKVQTEGRTSQTWEDEAVETTTKNIHSDAMLNVVALLVFIGTSAYWSHLSFAEYGWTSYAFSGVISLAIAGMFVDNAIFAWIKYIQTHRKN